MHATDRVVTDRSPENVPTPSELASDNDEIFSLKAVENGMAGTGNGSSVEFLSGFRLMLVMSAITLVFLLVMLDITILGTAIPEITSEFHDLGDAGWYIGAYQLSSATMQPVSGKINNYFSTKWSFLIFLLIFEIGSAICGAAQSSIMLIIGRAVAGIGSSGLSNGCIIMMQGACDPKNRPLYMGIAIAVGQVGVMLGPVLGGVLTQHASWRWCFYINLPLGGCAAMFIGLVKIREHIEKQHISWAYVRSILPHFDFAGFAIFAPASIMLLLALQFGGGEYGWRSSTVIGLFCGAAATTVVFVFWEKRMGDDAMIPLSLVGRRVVWSSSLQTSLMMMSALVGNNFIPIYLQSVKGLGPSMSGVYMLAAIGAQISMVVGSGILIKRMGYYMIWCLLASGLTTIGCGLVTLWNPYTTLAQIICFQLLLGGRGLGNQMGLVALQNALASADAAMATNFLMFVQMFFGSIFMTVGNAIFQETLRSGIATHVTGIGPEAAIAAGGSAEAVRKLASSGPQLDGLLQAYSSSFSYVFYMLAGTSALSFLVSFGMGWVDINKKKQDSKAGDA